MSEKAEKHTCKNMCRVIKEMKSEKCQLIQTLKKSLITLIHRTTSKNNTPCDRYTCRTENWARGAESKCLMHPNLAGSTCQFYRLFRVFCLVLEMHFLTLLFLWTK